MKSAQIDSTSYNCAPEIQARIAALPITVQHSSVISGRKLDLTLAMPLHMNGSDIVATVSRILHALLPHAVCSIDTIPITILFTDHKKQLPRHGPIGQIHVNTGYAVPCGYIVVYRAEEWCKVLIHECFHFLELDKKLDDDSVQSMFPIQSRIRLTETFSEVWARILNCGMRVESGAEVDRLLQREKSHAAFELVKILDYNGLTYADLLQKRPILANYREDTNVFAYIILGAILLFDPRKFMKWSGSLRAPANLSTLIRECATDQDFIDYIQTMWPVFEREKAANSHKYRSLRMSIIE